MTELDGQLSISSLEVYLEINSAFGLANDRCWCIGCRSPMDKPILYLDQELGMGFRAVCRLLARTTCC